MLGNPLPIDSEGISRISQQLRSELMFETSQIGNLANLPAMNDAIKVAVIQTLVSIIPPVYFGKPELLLPVILTMVNLSVKYGNAAPSCYGYCLYGLMLCGAFGNIDSGYEFGRLSLKVLEKFESDPIACQVFKVFASHIQPWKEPLRTAMKNFEMAIQTGLKTGNAEYLGYGCAEYCMYLLFTGENLEIVEQKYVAYVNFLENTKQNLGIFHIKIGRQAALNLAGKSLDNCCLTGESFNEKLMLPLVIKANYKMLIFCFYLFRSMLLYLFKGYDQALKNADLAAAQIDGVVGTIYVSEFNLYHSLALLGQYPSLSTNEQAQCLSQLTSNQEKMQNWAFHAPSNFEHKYYLVEAEKARVLGQTLEAMDYYDQAIQGAKAQGYRQEEALANELAAEFYLALGREKVAKVYMTDAYYGYSSWGATAKVKDLANRYPQLIVKQPASLTSLSQAIHPSITSSSSSISALLDLATVSKASHALASESILENLLNKLIKILIENVGAQKGFLISENSGNLNIEVAGTTEQNEVAFLRTATVDLSQHLPLSVINYVIRVRETVVLRDATNEGIFSTDPYIITNQPKSVLCTPIFHQGKLRNILYLENNLMPGAFTGERLEVLSFLSAQTAISLENALLYTNLSAANAQLEDYARTLEAKVAKRTLELQQKNASLEQATAQLKISNQELEAFSYSVSHDLKAPVRRINNFSQMLKEEAGEQLDQLSRNYLQRIQAASQQMGQLIEDLLRLSRLSRCEMHWEQVDLSAMARSIAQELLSSQSDRQVEFHIAERVNHLISEIEEIAQETFPKSIELSNDIAPDLWTVFGDATQLHQVLMNLVVNARDAMPDGGTLSISAVNLVSDEHYAGINLAAQVGAYIVITVADTGTGMPPEVMERIFEPFFTTKELGLGTGLGLYTVFGIIKSHGGFVNVYSEMGKGTRFQVHLPAVEEPQMQQAQEMELLTGNGELILLVDDEAAIREITKASLEASEYRVLTASDGIEALAVYTLHREEISVVLMDMMMPEMDGKTTIRTLQKINPQVKIIAVSGLVSNEKIAQATSIGVKAFLSKPCTAKELLQTINVVKQGAGGVGSGEWGVGNYPDS